MSPAEGGSVTRPLNPFSGRVERGGRLPPSLLSPSLIIMFPALCDFKIAFFYAVHNTMGIIYSAGPPAGQVFFERLRLSKTFKGTSFNVPNKSINLFQQVFILFLPVKIINNLTVVVLVKQLPSMLYLLPVMLCYANSILHKELSQQKSILLMPCYALYIPVFLKN